MTITRLHIFITVLIALALHGGVALWLALSTPTPLPVPPTPPLRISLLSVVADRTVNAAVTPSEPPPKPVSKPLVKPAPAEPQPAPLPVIQKTAVKKQPPIPEPQPPETDPLPKPTPETAQPAPAAPDVAPLDAAATARYEQLLVAWLEKYKMYPRRAKRLRIEGRGMLRILIDRTGRTLQVTLEQPTGNRLLDKAALDMAQRADPFPPIPENDPRRELEFIIPVVFALN